MMDEEKKKKVIRLLNEATAENEEKTIETKVDINGNNNIIGNGNTVINTEKHVTVVKVEPKPGVEHITEDQVCRLHDLKDEIIRLGKLAKKKPITPAAVWSALTKEMGCRRLRLIPLEKFEDSKKFLQIWIGRLNNTKSVENKDLEEVERKRLTYIRTNMRKLKCEKQVREYMEKHFGITSTKELPGLDAIKQVYMYVAGIKKKVE